MMIQFNYHGRLMEGTQGEEEEVAGEQIKEFQRQVRTFLCRPFLVRDVGCVRPVFIQPVFVQPAFVQLFSSNPIRLG